MRWLSRLIAATLLLVPAWAQAQEQTDEAALVREAFASPYGVALTAELGKSLRASADPACLADKGLNADQLEPRGHEVIAKWGTRLMEGTSALIDQASGGFAGTAELDRLKRDADVKRYLAVEAPLRQAKALDIIFEQFDRYNLINRVKLKAVSPLGTGNADLLKLNPGDATEEALDKFVSRSKSTALKRFLQLSEQTDAARAAAIKTIQPAPPLPHTFFRGVEDDLAELCIRSAGR